MAAHTHRYLHETGMSVRRLVNPLASAYEARTAPDRRIAGIGHDYDPNDADAYDDWRGRLEKRIERWLSCETRVQMDVLWAWFDVLPEPYRQDALIDLLAALGVLPVAIPEGEPTAADLGEVVRQAGEEQVAAAPIMEDGVINEQDLEHLPEAIRHSEESAAASLAWRARLVRAQQNLSGPSDRGAPHLRAVPRR